MRQKKSSKRNQRLANFALLVAAFIWGTAFVAQSVGMDYVGPFTFLWIRSFIGAIVLIPVSFFLDFVKKRRGIFKKPSFDAQKRLFLGGLFCGLSLCAASSLQQIGMQYTSVGNAGFLTSMYMILVPILSIFLGKKIKKRIWLCVVLAAFGIYFLSISEGFSISKGDALMVVCAVFFAVQIMIVDYFAPYVDGVKLSCIQFLVTGVIALLMALMFETTNLTYVLAAMPSILYAGVLSSGVAFTLQILAQKYAEPTIATLFMSLESVFSMLGGMVILKEFPSGRELFGCLLVFSGVVLSQINFEKKVLQEKLQKDN